MCRSGSDVADQVIEVLAGTGMFVGGVMAFILDNTIPGMDCIVRYCTQSILYK